MNNYDNRHTYPAVDFPSTEHGARIEECENARCKAITVAADAAGALDRPEQMSWYTHVEASRQMSVES
jgi:hypothetical protein